MRPAGPPEREETIIVKVEHRGPVVSVSVTVDDQLDTFSVVGALEAAKLEYLKYKSDEAFYADVPRPGPPPPDDHLDDPWEQP